MFEGGDHGVGLSVARLRPDLPGEEPDLPAGVVRRPARLGEVLQVSAMTTGEKTAELARLQSIKAQLVAYELELIASFAADRPAGLDREEGQPGAAVDGWVHGPGAEVAVSEFFPDELALVLSSSRTHATVLTDQAITLLRDLPRTWAAMADGYLDWPRARAIATELGEPAQHSAPGVRAAVEAVVLPRAGGLSVSGLKALIQRELLRRDAAAADRRRAQAARLADVRLQRRRDGMAELSAFLPAPQAAACHQTLDGYARLARTTGDRRPIGVLRAEVLADLIQRPWDTTRPPLTADLTVIAPLPALRAAAAAAAAAAPHATTHPAAGDPAATGPGTPPRTAGGAPDDTNSATATTPATPDPAARRPQGDTGQQTSTAGGGPAVTATHTRAEPVGRCPTGEVDGQPITATQLRELLEELDALCPGGLQPPTGGRLHLALTDPDTGALRAVLTRPELQRLAHRGCPHHPDPPTPRHQRKRRRDPGAASASTDGPPPTNTPTASTPADTAAPSTAHTHNGALPNGHPCSCGVLDTPPPVDRYTPSPAQSRFVATRDRTCRHPGCRTPAARTDLDHVHAHHRGGPTDCTNLCCLCRRHHRLKTHAPHWRFTMTTDGTLTVTTPSGITRTTHPPGMSAPDDDPPPF